jgi:Schlafen, AlbA_2
MPDDLYHANLNAINEADLYQSIVALTRVDQPKEERPHEGYLLDFKKELGDRFIQTIAAFANTFGGLLVLGVEDVDHDGRPDKLVGVATRGELKTTMSNVIGSNLVPCPMFDIAQCSSPQDPAKKLCVVRVRETAEICLITKKGTKNPVYVRVEDKSEPADASALHALLERKRQAQSATSDLVARLDKLRHRLTLSTRDTFGAIVYGETFFRLLLCPIAHPLQPLDLVVEEKFFDIVWNPGLVSLANEGEVKHESSRSGDWFEIKLYDPSHHYPRRWTVTSNADIGFLTETRWPISGEENVWSFYDLAADVVDVAGIAKQFWQGSGYYGGFRLEAQLRLSHLKISVGPDGFHPLYYQRIGRMTALPLPREVLALAKNPYSGGDASADLSFADLDLSLDEIVAGVLNQLLRSLGHAATIEKLKVAIRPLISTNERTK